MSRFTTCGSTSGGGGLPIGRLRFTAWSWIGMVMISITSNTSITSISGVVLMSIITSGSRPAPPGVPTFIDMSTSSSRPRWSPASAAAARRRLDHECDLRDARALAGIDHAPDALVVPARVAADLHLGLRRQHGDLLQAVDQRARRRQVEVVPVDPVALIDREFDVLGLRLADLVAILRELDRDRIADDRHGDQEDDQEHHHHVDERRRVDGRDRFVLDRVGGADGERHDDYALAGDCWDESSTACRSAPKLLTSSMQPLLRRI